MSTYRCNMAENVTTTVAGSLEALGVDGSEVEAVVQSVGRLLQASPDVLELKILADTMHAIIDWYELAALALRRHYGDSWGDLAAPMGMSRQGVQARFERLSVKLLEAGLDLPPWSAEVMLTADAPKVR